MRYFGTSLVIAVALGLPLASASQSRPTEFVFRPGDIVRITVWPDSSYNGEYPVEEDGIVYLPFVGTVRIAGQSLTKIRADLRTQFGREMQQPVVTVTPLFRVSILGEVNRPGLYIIDPTHSFFDVVALAGGFRDNAKTEDIRLVRDGERIQINADPENGEQAEVALALRSGDRIIVSKGRSINTLTIFYVLQS